MTKRAHHYETVSRDSSGTYHTQISATLRGAMHKARYQRDNYHNLVYVTRHDDRDDTDGTRLAEWRQDDNIRNGIRRWFRAAI